jgi:hypothetical protein
VEVISGTTLSALPLNGRNSGQPHLPEVVQIVLESRSETRSSYYLRFVLDRGDSC